MFDALPERIRRLAVTAFRTFVANPAHPGLRWHRMDDSSNPGHADGSISVSLGMQYRAVYFEDGDTNVWYWIGTHAQYDAFFRS